jgi:signal transduction histidine kinase
MANPIRTDILNFYQNKSYLKWIVVAVSVIISAGSIYYTNVLVSQLEQREQRQIELFARTLEYTISENFRQDVNFITEEILIQNSSIPTILVDENDAVVYHRNIAIDSSWQESRIDAFLQKELAIMKDTYDPIEVNFRDPTTNSFEETQYIYYKNSFLLTQLIYYPYVQLSVIALFGFIAYLAFNYSKRAEQNRVWVGLAKETAHQLGTPISSLIAWMEYFKLEDTIKDKKIIEELEKDIAKLRLITERFSSIGSVPILKEENIVELIENAVNYLRSRVSTKVNIRVHSMYDSILANINAPLFEWVIENLVKNAVDAMNGEGNLTIKVIEGSDWRVFIDIIDNGKGIPKSSAKQVFQPGYTTKKRGWGLGLALSKRIIENYHNGRIYVKFSEVDRGTIFRIILHRQKL